MALNSINDSRALFRSKLADKYEERSIDQLFYISLEHLGYTKIQVLQNRDMSLPSDKGVRLNEILTELISGRPIQYVLGETEFYGLKLLVNESVLIPRPETEELVEWILSSSTPNSLIDIGTGSGCIPIALASTFKKAQLIGVDVSEEAVTIAKANRELHGLNLEFEQLDIRDKSQWKKYEALDVIVSNPPYIDSSEKKQMPPHVLEHEPHLALFAPLGQALFFYDLITDFAIEKLSENGCLYFELNEFNSHQVVALVESKGFREIELKKDMSGKSRMLRALR